jgi:hypothetical protein
MSIVSSSLRVRGTAADFVLGVIVEARRRARSDLSITALLALIPALLALIPALLTLITALLALVATLAFAAPEATSSVTVASSC